MAELKLFVYGSLSEGMVHYQKIQTFVQASQEAAVSATAYRLPVGYPVVIEKGNDPIVGQVLYVKASPLLFDLLDQFHGVSNDDPSSGLFYRKEVAIETRSPLNPMDAEVSEEALETPTAYVYFLNHRKLPTGSQVIPAGDWRRNLAEKPTLCELLTERQRQYILKLGASTGREIVPIDLKLYRELIHLEIIVDKGRRLALTKLGHEVFRYMV